MDEGKTYGKFLNYLKTKVDKAGDWANSGYTTRGVVYKKLKSKVDQAGEWANSTSSPTSTSKSKTVKAVKKSLARKANTRTKKIKKTSSSNFFVKAFKKGYRDAKRKSPKRGPRPVRPVTHRTRHKKVKIKSLGKRYLRHVSPI